MGVQRKAAQRTGGSSPMRGSRHKAEGHTARCPPQAPAHLLGGQPELLELSDGQVRPGQRGNGRAPAQLPVVCRVEAARVAAAAHGAGEVTVFTSALGTAGWRRTESALLKGWLALTATGMLDIEDRCAMQTS